MSQHVFIHGHNLLTHKQCRWWCYHCDKVILICYIIYKVAAASEGSLCLLMCPGPDLVLGREEGIRKTKKEGSEQAYESWPGCRPFFAGSLPLWVVPGVANSWRVGWVQASSSTSELMLGFFLKAGRHVARPQVSVHDIWQHCRGVQWCTGREVILCWMGCCSGGWQHCLLFRLQQGLLWGLMVRDYQMGMWYDLLRPLQLGCAAVMKWTVFWWDDRFTQCWRDWELRSLEKLTPLLAWILVVCQVG